MFAPTAGIAAVMLAFTMATVSLRCSERIDRVDEIVTPASTASHMQQSPLESETDWLPSAGFDDLDADFYSDVEEICEFSLGIRRCDVATFCVFQPQAAPTITDLPGFRVVPKSLRHIALSESAEGFLAKRSLFQCKTTSSPISDSRSETMDFAMLETILHWGRLRVECKLSDASISEAVLREFGKGKQGVQRLELRRLLAEIIPVEGSDLSAGIFVLSPTRLEGALETVVKEQSAFAANTEVLRFEEICLPDRNDSDRRHIRRVVFIAVEASNKSSRADVIQALADSTPEVRKSILADLTASDSHGYVIGEFRTRVSFVK